MGGALDGVLTRVMPIGDCLLGETSFRTVMREEFWLCLSGLRKLGFQDLSNPLMVLLPRAFQE
jgi:hypothetical protein